MRRPSVLPQQFDSRQTEECTARQPRRKPAVNSERNHSPYPDLSSLSACQSKSDRLEQSILSSQSDQSGCTRCSGRRCPRHPRSLPKGHQRCLRFNCLFMIEGTFRQLQAICRLIISYAETSCRNCRLDRIHFFSPPANFFLNSVWDVNHDFCRRLFR